MTFEFWGLAGLPFFGLPANIIGYGLLVAYTAILIARFWRTSDDFGRLKRGQWLLFIALLVISPILITSLRIRLPGVVAPPGVPAEPLGPTLALLGYIPIFLAAGLLGNAPAIVLGVVVGLARAGWDTYRLTTIVETAFAAALIAWCIRQDFRGPVARLARQPLVAGAFTAIIIWLFSFASYFSNSNSAGFIGLDYVAAEWWNSAIPRFGELIIAGMVTTLVALAFPAAWAPTFGNKAPPYSTSLNRRLIFTLFPLAFVGLFVLGYVNLWIANDVATTTIIEQMGNNAQTVASSIPYFAQTGQSILNTLATDSHIQNPNRATLSNWLEEQIRGVAFFQSIALVDQQGSVIGAYPENEGLANGLTDDEKAALSFGVPQTLTLDPEDPQVEGVSLSFIVPVTDASGNVTTTLIGRTNIEDNPILKPAIGQLRSLQKDNGAGFIVDERNQIIFHTDPSQVTQSWQPAEQPSEPLATTLGGAAYRDSDSNNARILVYYLPVPGYPWSVGIMMPNEVVTSLAARIVLPLILFLLIIGLLGAWLVLAIVNQITKPLESLAHATAGIAQGEFDQPVRVAGEDEVGRLGVAFERMRERLRARLGELNLLLRVSQGIAGSLSLDQSLPPVLDGALNATNGGGARLVVLNGGNAPQVFSSGSLGDSMAPMDNELLQLTQNEGRLVLENISRARTVLNTGKVAGQVQALIALPLKQEQRFLGTLWVGFGQPHPFTQTEVNFVSTLAGQAALAVSNAHLYEASEGGRQQLQAILASSPDAVIVTDGHERVMLINPAAENTFGVTARSAAGKPLKDVIDRPELVELMRGNEMATPREVPMADGRTLFASASPIVAADGGLLGRVAVLRDVTYFKQLDELKSEFVATVSHDLRVPLTYMRGYATMLPMVGSLNPKQEEFATKIVGGIEQMSGLIEDLLDLNRIEAGVGLAQEPCRIDEIINEAVANLRNNAANKNISLNTELITTKLPTLNGDRTLLRTAISNLVDNAIKYTPNNGKVKVTGDLKDGNIVIAVQDSGIGIAPTDQARLFEKFFRVKQRDTLGIKGSGLGLAIVKSIVERHGGRLWVESRLGQGSTFSIALPV